MFHSTRLRHLRLEPLDAAAKWVCRLTLCSSRHLWPAQLPGEPPAPQLRSLSPSLPACHRAFQDQDLDHTIPHFAQLHGGTTRNGEQSATLDELGKPARVLGKLSHCRGFQPDDHHRTLSPQVRCLIGSSDVHRCCGLSPRPRVGHRRFWSIRNGRYHGRTPVSRIRRRQQAGASPLFAGQGPGRHGRQ